MKKKKSSIYREKRHNHILVFNIIMLLKSNEIINQNTYINFIL